MGKRIIQQRRGRGTHTYKVKQRAFRYKVLYPQKLEGKGKVVKLIASAAHSTPLAKVVSEDGKKVFYIPAFKNMFGGLEIEFGGKEVKEGNIMALKDIPEKTKIFCIESRPGDGGKFIKGAGSSAEINRKVGEDVFVVLPSKKEKKLNGNCRAIIGVTAGDGRLDKPVVKAGKMYHIKKSKSKLWPRTGALKMNAIDHPLGSGRGKVPKANIPKRNASPGQKVGLLRPKRSGKRK